MGAVHPARGWSFSESPQPLGGGGTRMGTWMVAVAAPGASTHVLGVTGVSSRPFGGPRRVVPCVGHVPCVPSALPGWDRAQPTRVTPRGTGGAGGAAGPARPHGCGKLQDLGKSAQKSM